VEEFFKQGYKDLPKLPIRVIAGCDKDPRLKDRFDNQHPKLAADLSWSDLRHMVNAVIKDQGLRKSLSNADIMTVSAPCQGRSVLREMMSVDKSVEFSEDEIFFLQCILIELLKPKRIISEMTPPNKTYSQDHYAVGAQIQSYGYEVNVTDKFPSDLCGDIQARVRWILIGRRTTPGKILKPFGILHNLKCRVPRPISTILEPHHSIPHDHWVAKDFVHIFEDPSPYPEDMTNPESGTYGYPGGTRITNWENAELTMLLKRLNALYVV